MTGVDLGLLDRWIREFARVIGENAGYLTDLDAAVGDADHGTNMDRGMKAVVARLDDATPRDLAEVCKQVATALISSVGERSAGHLDPGAASSALLIAAAATAARGPAA